MITSHELARMLLARRDHTLYVEVLVLDDNEDDNVPWPTERTELRDVPGHSFTIPAEELLEYDSRNDVLVLKAGLIVGPDKGEVER